MVIVADPDRLRLRDELNNIRKDILYKTNSHPPMAYMRKIEYVLS